MYRDYLFNLGVEKEVTDDIVLNKLYCLTEDPEFEPFTNSGFTIVLEDHKNLLESIGAFVAPLNGKVIFDKPFNNRIANPVLIHFAKTLGRRS